MNKLLILTVALILQSCDTYTPDTYTPYTLKYPIAGDYADKYACNSYNRSRSSQLILFMAANPSKSTGAVYVSGKEFKAKYNVEGIGHTWRYSNNEYLIQLNPDGNAYYFDFNTAGFFDTSVLSSAIFKCRLISQSG